MLSDILGDEDHLGDMDFKVAGTEAGVTSLQMDIKITSITEEIMQTALAQARDGRLHILGEMTKALSTAREGVSENAPRITVIQINKDKIREVIGPGGKVIREICEETGAKIDIEDDGTVKVAAVDEKASEAAIQWIKGITAEPEVGEIYTGKVVKDRRLRRLRELHGLQGRPGPHFGTGAAPGRQNHRHRQCGRRGEGQAHRDR